MASTSRASRKTVEDAEIFQVLQESTDSDFTIFSSEEDEGGDESDSDMVNWMTILRQIKKEALLLTWTGLIH